MTERPVTAAQFDRLAKWSMRKPVMALMGEFSSGKSTLLNLLMGQDILPTQVTATRMPPVWLSHGDAAPYRMDHDGTRHKVSLSNTGAIPITKTSYIRVFCKADILKRCDLIDTPGISDPNIKTSYWLRTIRYANAVMWCTHAGQAWRESERGAWEDLPKRLRETSILLVTRKDKITSDRDLLKIKRRLERETEHLFNARMFVSLTNAFKAREAGNVLAWEDSGAAEFADMLEQIIEGVYVRRSDLLSRYVVGSGDKALRPMAAPDAGPETGGILGFVGQDAGEAAAEEVDAPMLGTMADDVGAPAPAVGIAAEQADAPEAAPEVTVEKAGAPTPLAEEAERPEPAPDAAPEAKAEAAPVPIRGTSFVPVRVADPARKRAAQAEPATKVGPISTTPAPVVAHDDAETPGFQSAGADLDIRSHRLADPSGRADSAKPRVDLASYRLRDPSPGRVETDDDRTDVRPESHAEPAMGDREVDRIRALWNDVRQQHDLSQVPSLVRAVEDLIDDLGQDRDLRQKKSA